MFLVKMRKPAQRSTYKHRFVKPVQKERKQILHNQNSRQLNYTEYTKKQIIKNLLSSTQKETLTLQQIDSKN